MKLDGKRGAGAFQWNRGGWFGCQVGATLWPLLLGVGTFIHVRPLGTLLIALGLVPHGVGIALWRRRHGLAPYPAIQALLAACGLAALLSVVAVKAAGLSPSSLGLPSGWVLLMYPVLMLAFHHREERVRRAA